MTPVPEQLKPAVPKPCDECPWVRTSLPGYLGPYTAEEWCQLAHSDAPIACHKTVHTIDEEGNGSWEEIRQCAGAAIFRANICKSSRLPQVAQAEADHALCFSWDNELIAHHEGEDE